MKKKILYVDHTPFIGGAELVLVSHIKHLDKSKYEPLVACSGTVPELIERYNQAGAKVFVIPFGQLKVFNPRMFLRLLRSVKELSSLIRRNGADLVVTNTERAMYVGTLSAILARKKLVWWVRDFEYNRFLFRLLLRFPQKIICVSKAIRDYYSLTENPKAEVVYVGSDFDERLRQVSLEDVLLVKEELGLTGAGLIVGYVGRLVRWKGPQVLVESVKGLKGIEGIKVVIVGTGRGQEGNVEPELRRMVKDWGLEDRVILTGHRQDVPVLMKVFDIFCHTSVEPEPFATVIIEAMLAGTPVIGTNIGGTPEIISDSQTGFLVRPDDSKALIAVLSHLVHNRSLREKVGRKGKEVALIKNTEAVITRQVERILEQL